MTPKDFFTVLSDETRLRCLLLLHKEKEICVCEFAQVLNSIQPKISRHLGLLRKAGIILDRRKGQWVYYQINENIEMWMKSVLGNIFSNIENQEPYLSDLKKFTLIRNHTICN